MVFERITHAGLPAILNGKGETYEGVYITESFFKTRFDYYLFKSPEEFLFSGQETYQSPVCICRVQFALHFQSLPCKTGHFLRGRERAAELAQDDVFVCFADRQCRLCL